MMKTTMYSFRMPIELRDVIVALQAKHGYSSQAEVIVQAIAHFTNAPVTERQNADNQTGELTNQVGVLTDQVGQLTEQLTALNDRLTALELVGDPPVAEKKIPQSAVVN